MKEKAIFVVSRWLLAILAMGGLAAMTWTCNMLYKAFLLSNSESWTLLMISAGVLLLLFLVASGAIDLCSVRMTDSEVHQTKFFESGRLFVKKQIRWDEITDVQAKPGAYRLSNSAITVEIHTMIFGKPKLAEQFILEKIPK